MGIELRFFVDEKETDARKALKEDRHTIVCMGTTFFFKMKYDEYFGYIAKSALDSESDLDELKCGLTARSYGEYRHKAKSEYGIDLDKLVNENLDKKWVEVGSGLGGFTPRVAKMLAEAQGPKITIVDPIDYQLLCETIIALKEFVPGFRLGTTSIPELLRRIKV